MLHKYFIVALLLSPACFVHAQNTNDTTKKTPTVYNYVQQMPEFNGNYSQYIQANLTYPVDARLARREGKVLVRFLVNIDGTVSDVSVIKPVDSSLDAEAIRVVKNMPNWKPAKQDGKPVKVWFTLPINFQLNTGRK